VLLKSCDDKLPSSVAQFCAAIVPVVNITYLMAVMLLFYNDTCNTLCYVIKT